MKKEDKILFVIPAYNEAENIEKVLKEIKKDAPFADVLVINDCSRDNTSEIVEKNGVKCITGIFNLRYAWAVQTGIKYAYFNNYDYVHFNYTHSTYVEPLACSGIFGLLYLIPYGHILINQIKLSFSKEEIYSKTNRVFQKQMLAFYIAFLSKLKKCNIAKENR